jgi:hypothetical protein
VERIGFEPTTPCLQSRCATSCATAPRKPESTCENAQQLGRKQQVLLRVGANVKGNLPKEQVRVQSLQLSSIQRRSSEGRRTRGAQEHLTVTIPEQIPARDGEACEGRTALRVAELGSSVMFPTRATWFITTSLPGAFWLRPKPFRRIRNKSAPEQRNATDEVERALMSAQRAVAWRS